MESLVDYFETIPSSMRSLILVSGIAFFWLLEYAVPLFRAPYKKLGHAGINIFFTLTTVVVNFVLAFLLLRSSDWTVNHSFGVLHWLSMPLWVEILVGVALLDLISAWLAHWVQHKIRVLWGFHLVHHTDNHVDTTTANRHHPGESVVRFVFTCLAVLVVGAPVGIIMLYQSLSIVFSQFNHANIALPKKLDDVLSWVIVSPDMHKVHHHNVLPYTDTNYGNLFSIWDRLFGTFAKMRNDEIVYGVDTYPNEAENSNIRKLLGIPFQKNRRPTTNIQAMDSSQKDMGSTIGQR